MSLPPGFIDELRTRVSLSSVVGRKVTWDLRKSNMGKGDMWAPCPFHQEKSASFHVDDRKGFYYCFGCHAKGDAVSFVKETENVGFLEAVEILAREAGMAIPARDPQAAQKADRRTQLSQVLDEAIKWFRLQLRSTAGSAARDYITKRRISPEGQDRFEIGFAPDQRQGLYAALTAKGIAPDLIIDAGLAIKPDDEPGKSSQPYDRFRGRIIFPIRDVRGRAISLGGRAMDPNARAKYLNGPETELFDKGRSLYNMGPAREAAGKGKPLIVAEGYMDVIALSEAGFTAAVAPLGTAVTEDQLRLMWRIHPEPIIALDGDKAGTAAALRVIDLALPVLDAGQGLRFAILPMGLDPDDLIKSQGAAAMQQVLDSAMPMVRLLWNRETQDKTLDSPERKAALRKSLRVSVVRIKDPDIRRYYAEAFRHFESVELRPKDWLPEFRKRGAKGSPRLASSQAKASLLARLPADRVIEYMRESAILAILLRHPSIAAPFEGGLERLEMIEEGHSAFLHVILENCASETDEIIYGRVCDAVGREAVERLMTSAHILVLPAIKNREDAALAADTLAEQLAKLSTERALRQEVEDAKEDMTGLVNEGLTWRLSQAAQARNRAQKTDLEEVSEAGEDRSALSKHLQNMIDGEVWVKKKG